MEPFNGLFRKLFGRRNPHFLLPETKEVYEKLLSEARETSETRRLATLARAEGLVGEARVLKAQAHALESRNWSNSALLEKARRQATAIRKNAEKLEKSASDFFSVAKRLRRRPWVMAEQILADYEKPSFPYRKYWEWAADVARSEEARKILKEGVCLLATPEGEERKEATIRHERRVIHYRGKCFLAMLAQECNVADADWWINWVSASMSQMKESELEAAATAMT